MIAFELLVATGNMWYLLHVRTFGVRWGAVEGRETSTSNLHNELLDITLFPESYTKKQDHFLLIIVFGALFSSVHSAEYVPRDMPSNKQTAVLQSKGETRSTAVSSMSS